MHLAATFHRVRHELLNLVFPPHCANCRAPGTLLCDACVERFPRLKPPFCNRCGRSTPGWGVCQPCGQQPLEIDGIRSVVLLEDGARLAVHKLKYSGHFSLASSLARLMADSWRANPLTVDVFAAVPLHIARERERGYNQAYLLGQEFGRMVGLPPMSGTLKRVRETRAQVGLGASERRANVLEAFVYQAPGHGQGVQGQRVLLIDDVCTTGATLESCSVALKAAGAASVWGFTLARAAQLSYA